MRRISTAQDGMLPLYDEESRKHKHPALSSGVFEQTPAMTYSRPRRTTIGPGCLTAVFGMGTGVAIQVCSPRKTFHSPA